MRPRAAFRREGLLPLAGRMPRFAGETVRRRVRTLTAARMPGRSAERRPTVDVLTFVTLPRIRWAERPC